jgi:glycosyltransferase involved in cell wall biosynthesis
MDTAPLVSVVIPTRDSAASLPACLDSIVGQTYAPIEIVVVDNYSTDATCDIAHAVTPFVFTYGPERSAQRNAGARAASGSYLAFIDSDMVLAATVIARCVQVVTEDTAVKGIIIPERSVGEGFWARCKALERSCYVGDDTIEAARFFDHGAFESVGGYDESLTAAEDWDLSRRVRDLGSLRRIDTYITHLEGHLTLRKTMRTKFYYGTTLGRYIHKQPAAATRQLQLVRPAFVRHWRRLLAHPVLAAGMVAMKGCEFAAGGTGLVVASRHRGRISRTG